MTSIKTLNICFLGKTGYGKSSIINGLFGTSFSTDPFYSCTKELYSVTTIDGAPDGFDAITIYDTPGIGEFPDNDHYQKYYNIAASTADVIVLVTTLSRNDAPEQELLRDIRKKLDLNRNLRFVIALNHIDSPKVALTQNYCPWLIESNIPSQECLSYIKERTENIHEKFDYLFMKSIIVPVCAMYNYGLDELKTTILNTNKISR